jgi:hypothetical protein
MPEKPANATAISATVKRASVGSMLSCSAAQRIGARLSARAAAVAARAPMFDAGLYRS